MATGKKPNEKILVFEPHPDDVAFQISGSVRKWINEGGEVAICTVTTGNNSTFDPGVSSEQIEEIMLREHREAMKLLGVDDDHYVQWHYNDLGIDPGLDRPKLLSDMVKLIRKFKPVTVVTMDPKNITNEENPDHRAVAMTGFEAAALAAAPNFLPEQFAEPGVEQHFVSRALFYMSPEPDTFIDISDEPFDTKIKLGFVYDSQLELLTTEAKQRLSGMGVELELFDMPKDQLWPMVCRQMAEAAAEEARRMYPHREKIELAEAFRMQYIGVVEKIRDFLPDRLKFD